MSIVLNELVLHVGLPKTATSALQTFLYENKTELRQQQYAYPGKYLHKEPPKHQFLVNNLLRNDLSQLEDVLRSPELPGMILSTEGLTNHLYDFPGEALKRFRSLTHSCKVRVFIVTRNEESWLRSYYKQAVLNPDTSMVDYYATELTLDKFRRHPRIIQLLDHETLIRDVANAFGALEIINAVFEKNWMGTFAEVIRLQFENDRQLKQVNESPANWAIELMRQVNTFKLPESKRLGWKAALHQFLRSNHILLKNSLKSDCTSAEFNLEPSILATVQAREEDVFSLTKDQIKRFQEFLEENSFVISSQTGDEDEGYQAEESSY